MTTRIFLKHRNIWLGIAMLWVVWFHLNWKAPIASLERLKLIGYGGVDICLFASGAGCYLSLCRNSDPWQFMKRRFSRLLPTYFLFIPFWILFCFLTGNMTLRAALGNLLNVQYFTAQGPFFNWYVSAIMLLYLLSPMFKSLADQTQGILRHLVILLLLIALSIPFWYLQDLLVFATRLPIFYLGILLGKLHQQNAPLRKSMILVSLAGSCAGLALLFLCSRYLPGYLLPWGLWWYPFLLITPGMCFAISLIAEKLTQLSPAKPVLRLLDIIGQHSFEIYLVHLLVKDIYMYLLTNSLISSDSPFVRTVVIASIILGTAALRFGTDALRKAVQSIA